ncbi:hypothetical protein DL768_003232 [Monosporascus sp. mg162]|nr:hypothetical protein DL768_003232 [Monosporascus sp. mg162]
MTTSEEQELMAKIGSLASKINRHKAQQHNTNFGYHGPGRNRYRNKTLVLNGQSGSAQSVDTNAASNSTSPSWVSKTDRHLQLINSAIYEKEAQSRSNAIEQTHRHRQRQRDNREKSKLANFARQNANHVAASSSASASATKFEITVDGIHFHVLKGGNKLVKLPGDVNPPSATPKVAFIGGVRLAGGVKKVNEQCKAFSWNGIVFLKRTGFAYLATSLIGVAIKGCKRPHIERASVLRRAGNRSSPEEMDDISSDDDFAADSDDIDSDGVEEFVGKDEVEDARFSEQTDFISF